MESGIRFVAFLDGEGNVVEKQVRKGVKLLLPEELLERAISQIIIVWTIAEEVGK
jgi:hypothetical protein